MFRLTAFLVFGIGTAMYFADEIGGVQEQPATAAISIDQVEHTPFAGIVEDKLDDKVSLASLSIPMETTQMKPAIVPEAEKSATVTLASFNKPMVVNSDGSLTETAVEQPELAASTDGPDAENLDIDVQYVTANRVNVRQGPSTSHSVLGKVVFAEAVQVLTDPGQEWVMIRIEGDGVEGYMASRFLQENDPQS